MKYALIAAGQGSRLRQDGILVPKPLVEIGGVPLIGRQLQAFLDNGAESVSVIVNEEMTEVRAWLQALRFPVPLHLVVKSTPGSFHSFYELYSSLGEGPCCLTTVDPVYDPREFAGYIRAFHQSSGLDALMAVTAFVDDEKPLYVRTSGNTVVGYASSRLPDTPYVSGGIYCLGPRALRLLPQAFAEGLTRMRQFQQYLVDAGLCIQAFPFRKIIDIDHADDVCQATRFLNDLSL